MVRSLVFDPCEDRRQVVSFGGGTQSTAIAVLILQERLPRPDLVLFVDTGREASETLSYFERWTRPALEAFGVPVVVARSRDWATVDLFSANGSCCLLPAFTTREGRVGKLPAFCSGEWKRAVVHRVLRSRGFDAVDLWIGYSLEEFHHRASVDRLDWIRQLYPLVDLKLRRCGCVSLVEAFGWPEPARSSCWMCSNRTDEEWQRLPVSEFRRAVELEEMVRERDPHLFLHSSCVPLGEVVFDGSRDSLFAGGCVGGCFT